jgi:taurine dioxygenase
LPTASVDHIHQALLKHIVIVVRGQELTPQQFRDALALFGEPMLQHRAKFNLDDCPEVSIVTNIGGFGKATMWHTDHTNHERPPKITALHAIELPSRGGATWFANMYAGLEALSAERRLEVEALFTLNSMENNPGYSETDRARYPSGVRHPMVRTHPETGRKALYFHPTKSQQIEGVDDDDVVPLLDALLSEAVQPSNVYKHTWQPGDVVLVDNRCAMHRAEHDYREGEHRLLWRVILRGDRPA